MKFFAFKNFLKKFVVIFAVLISLSFAAPKPVAAGWGGELMEPICDLLVGICDGIVNIIHSTIIDQDLTLIKVDMNDGWESVFRIVLSIVVAVGVIALIIACATGVGFAIGAVAAKLFAGTTAAAVAGSTLGSVIGVGIIAGIYCGAQVYTTDAFDDEVVIPIYTISPEEIFRGDIPLFDVNFFNPSDDAYITTDTSSSSDDFSYPDDMEVVVNNKYAATLSAESATYNGITAQDIIDNGTKVGDYKYVYIVEEGDNSGTYLLEYSNQGTTTVVNEYYVTISYSSTILDTDTDTESVTIYAYSIELAETISAWYYRLLIIAIVGMMSVLVYVGIRILISSTAPQKAKYKQMLGDWLVGVVLLFTLHFIMIFANLFTENLTDLFASINPRAYFVILPDKDEKIVTALEDAGYTIVDEKDSESTSIDEIYTFTDDGTTYVQIATNLMGTLRVDLQTYKNDSARYIGYTVMFIVMVMYLVIFCYQYIKRVIMMAFLTLIAPLVALTYPIDKANDGKAQGFSFWFREYIFNLLLQPLHLLLYTILISSAIELATKNMIYAVIAIGFMTPAEKLLRQMFNFNKASTPGVFGGAVGGAATMSFIRWLTGHGPGGGKAIGGAAGSNQQSKNEDGKITTSKGLNTMSNDDISAILGKPKKNIIKPLKSSESELDNSKDSKGGNSWPSYSASLDEADFAKNGMSLDEARAEFEKNGMDFDEDKYNFAKNQEYQDLVDRGLSTDQARAEFENQYKDFDEDLYNDIWSQQFINDDEDIDLGDEGKGTPIRSTISAYGKGIGQKVGRSLADSDPFGTIGRIGAGAIGAATIGTVGFASGVASGDAEKTAQNTVGAMAGGYKLASNVSGSLSRALQVDGLGEIFERERLGTSEYNRREAERSKERAKQSEENLKKYQNAINIQNRAKAQEGLNQMVDFYSENKVGDFDDMIKMEKMAVSLYKDNIRDVGNQKVQEAFRNGVFNNIDPNSDAGKAKISQIKKDAQNEFINDKNRSERAMNIARKKACYAGRGSELYGINSKLSKEKLEQRKYNIRKDNPKWDDTQVENFVNLCYTFNKINNGM